MEFLQGQLESTFINTYYLRNVKIWVFTFQPKLGYLIKRGTTWNNLELARNDLKWPTATYNEQETTWNFPQRVRHNLQRTYLQRAKKDAKRPTISRFWDYFIIWYNRFSSLTRFPPNVSLQSFEHCFTYNHGENRASNISILSCVLLRDIKFRGYVRTNWHS